MARYSVAIFAIVLAALLLVPTEVLCKPGGGKGNAGGNGKNGNGQGRGSVNGKGNGNGNGKGHGSSSGKPGRGLGRNHTRGHGGGHGKGHGGGGGSSATCVASTIAGFDHMVDLNGKGLMLHWTVAGSALNAAIEAKVGSGAETGYAAVGWSATGRMVGDAVIAVAGGSVSPYSMKQYSVSPSALDLGATSLDSSTGGMVAKFSRGSDGTVPVNLSGSNTIVYAWSSSPSVDNHGSNKGSKVVNLACA